MGKGKDRDRGGRDGEFKKPWKYYSTAIPGTSGERLWLNKDGGAAAGRDEVDPEWAGGYGFDGYQAYKNRTATKRSAEKLNNYLDRTGNSLKPGKGMAVVDHKAVWIKPEQRFGSGPGINLDVAEGFREYVPIYGAVSGSGGGGDGSGGGGGKSGKKDKTDKGTEDSGAFEGTDEANAVLDSGEFDTTARPTYGEEFLQDYINADEDLGADPEAPILQQSASASSSLASGYPEESGWTPPVYDGSSSSGGNSAEDDEELSRSFAASADFRERLFQAVGA